MIELPLVFVSGILGSSHCVGMCGPFALLIGAAASDWRANIWRQVIYGVGRIFTYCFLGACAGFGGLVLTHQWDSSTIARWTTLPAAMSISAGLFLIYQGLLATGLIPRRGVTGKPTGCMASSIFASYLKDGRTGSVFFAGLFTGLLPCGLVYGFLALAASSGNVTTGILTMALFGLGTLPVMVATGCGGAMLRWQLRARLLRMAAWAVVLTGIVCLVRGFGFLSWPGVIEASGCPLC